MYYRRKILLCLLQKAKDNTLGKIDLQKRLFLIMRKQSKPCFDFVPYRYGCFSFQANKDLEVLSHHYALIDNQEKHWVLKDDTENYFCQLKKEDQNIINSVVDSIKGYNTTKLTKYVYDIDPYFTIYSVLKLDAAQKIKKEKQKQQIEKTEKQLFSIGYEGVSIDAYLNVLVKNNVKLLCDVRKNPLSMKYGFSKNQLAKYCECLHIEYVHIPDLGIDSKLRQNLHSLEDYERLFKEYACSLETKKNSLEYIKKLLKQYKRIALTCFEKDYHSCHRHTLINHYIKTIEKVNPVHL